MKFHYTADQQSTNRWIVTILGVLALMFGVVQVYRVLTEPIDFMNLAIGPLFLIMGLYNLYIGLGAYSKTKSGRSYVQVDDKGIHFKRELQRAKVYLWADIRNISIRRSGVYIFKDEKPERLSYDLLPYRQVHELRAAILEKSTHHNVTATLDLQENINDRIIK